MAAAAIGLVGYLYALGGIVVWLRVQTAQLTPDGVIVATNDRHLLAVGARVVAFELFLLVTIGAVIAAVIGVGIVYRGELPKRPPTKELRLLKQAWDDWGTLGGFIGPEIGLLLIMLGLSLGEGTLPRWLCGTVGAVVLVTSLLMMLFRTPPPAKPAKKKRWRWLEEKGGWRGIVSSSGNALGTGWLRGLAIALLVTGVGVAIFAVPLLQGTILLAGTAMIYAGPFVNWPDHGGESFHRRLLRSGGFWMAIAGFTVVALAWVATPPVDFTEAKTENLEGKMTAQGAYLDRAEGGVYLGVCAIKGSGDAATSTEAHIQFVPAEDSARLVLGHETYEFDPGGRPSIWLAFKSIIGGGGAAGGDAPLSTSLREQAGRVCGS